MIKSLLVDNFKPFNSVQRANLAPLTFIYGPNSQGKSSLIQSLLLLKQSAAGHSRNHPVYGGPLRPKGPHHDFGSIRQLIHNQRPWAHFGLGVGWDLNSLYYESEGFSEANYFNEYRYQTASIELSFRSRQPKGVERIDSHWLSNLKYNLLNNKNFVESFSLLQNGIKREVSGEENPIIVPLGHLRLDTLEDTESFAELLRKDSKLETMGEEAWQVTRQKLRRAEFNHAGPLLPEWISEGNNRRGRLEYKPIGITDDGDMEIIRSWQDIENSSDGLLQRISESFQRLMNNTIYIGPWREPAPRGSVLVDLDNAPTGVGQTGEYTTLVLQQCNTTERHNINRWIKELGLDYRLQLENKSDRISGQNFGLTLAQGRSRSIDFSVRDVGFGVSQILPIVIQGEVSQNQTICIEQPEIHLHPRMQANVADFLHGTYKSNGNQWIVETHSELLIRRIRRRIKEKSINPEEVSVIYVQPDPRDGRRSIIIEIGIDSDGEFIGDWPSGFFEEGFDELMAMNRISSNNDLEITLG